MFQYALFKNFKENGVEVKLDISAFKTYKLHNGYELNRVFGIEEELATIEDIDSLGDCRLDVYSNIRRKILGFKSSHYTQKNFEYSPEIFGFNNKYLDGYWQSEKFFESCKHKVISDFEFKGELCERNLKIKSIAEVENSISIHIRRGDYVSNPKANNLHGNICNLEYYRNAIKFFTEKITNPVFIVFSDDIEWVKDNLKISNCHFVSWNKGEYSYNDMRLMSFCKHNIIANSSFSWWGAYLNKNPKKIVVSPNKWFNDKKLNTVDLIPDGWHKIDVRDI